MWPVRRSTFWTVSSRWSHHRSSLENTAITLEPIVKEKRQQYKQVHNKVIFLQDSARTCCYNRQIYLHTEMEDPTSANVFFRHRFRRLLLVKMDDAWPMLNGTFVLTMKPKIMLVFGSFQKTSSFFDMEIIYRQKGGKNLWLVMANIFKIGYVLSQWDIRLWKSGGFLFVFK